MACILFHFISIFSHAVHLSSSKQWNASSSSSASASTSTEKCPSQSRINTKIVSIKTHQPTSNTCIGSSVRNQLLRNSIADNAHTLHLFGFYDKNNDVFEETDTERCGVCENWRTHKQQVSLFFVSPSLHVRQTHIYHNEYAKFTPKTRAENAKAKARKKSLPHSFAYRYKNICRLMIILPKFIGPATLCGVHWKKWI